jgi:hypothetical protein
MPQHLTRLLNLGLSQHEIDFVDVHLNGDTPLFLDPYFLGLRKDAWSSSCTRTIRSFFEKFLDLLRAGNEDAAFQLFLHLNEPGETFLGMSKGRSQGRGVGDGDAEKIFESLKQSKAVQSGIVEDLEDCRLFVEGIDKDKTSDMTTNIIRKHLIEYTQAQCRNYNIALHNAPSGFMWDRETKQWVTAFTEMLIVNNKKVLMVPKAVVSYSAAYTPQQYHQHFILNFLQNEHLRLGTALVEERRRKNGGVTRFVTKKRLRQSVAPPTKQFITQFTADHPEVFANFKAQAISTPSSLPNSALTGQQIEPVIDHLLAELPRIPSGDADAIKFHKTVAAILELLFYPNLVAPEIEVKIHEGRKRIDVVYDNAATRGFFSRLHQTYRTPCQFIFVECKNYSRDIVNPELDQMGGRFSPNRGQFGIIVCRTINDMPRFLQRCADTYRDQRGIILPLTDADLITALNNLKTQGDSRIEETLQARFRSIALT